MAGQFGPIHATVRTEQLRVIGIDEISIRKGHTYAIVVADLDQRRPIWLGGQGRTEKDMNLFFETMGTERCHSIKLAVMDMWKPFRKSTHENAPNAILPTRYFLLFPSFESLFLHASVDFFPEGIKHPEIHFVRL